MRALYSINFLPIFPFFSTTTGHLRRSIPSPCHRTKNANAVKGKLQEQLKMANHILALAELARKAETEQEKVTTPLFPLLSSPLLPVQGVDTRAEKRIDVRFTVSRGKGSMKSQCSSSGTCVSSHGLWSTIRFVSSTHFQLFPFLETSPWPRGINPFSHKSTGGNAGRVRRRHEIVLCIWL